MTSLILSSIEHQINDVIMTSRRIVAKRRGRAAWQRTILSDTILTWDYYFQHDYTPQIFATLCVERIRLLWCHRDKCHIYLWQQSSMQRCDKTDVKDNSYIITYSIALEKSPWFVDNNGIQSEWELIDTYTFQDSKLWSAVFRQFLYNRNSLLEVCKHDLWLFNYRRRLFVEPSYWSQNEKWKMKMKKAKWNKILWEKNRC